MAKTLQPNQIADAIITAPGASITALNYIPSGNRDIDTADTSFKTIGTDEAEKAEGEFVVPYSGAYRVMFEGSCFGVLSASQTSIEFQLVIDESGFGGYTETVISNSWRRLAVPDGEHIFWSFLASGTIDLDAGVHKVAIQAKHLTGSGKTFRFNVSTPLVVQIDAVTGSGAGGTLIDTANTGEVSITGVYSPSLSPTEVTALELSITCADNERLEINLLGRARLNAYSAGAWVAAYLKIDDVYVEVDPGNPYPEAIMAGRFTELNHPVNISFHYISDPQVGGTHTIKFFFSKWESADDSWLLRTAQSYVRIFRGGLVPVLKDGVLVQDKPRAIDYGPAFDVTNDSGIVSVQANGLWRYLDATNLPTGAAAPEAVWQFDGTGSELDDRTANGHDGTASATVLHSCVEGLVGLVSEDSFNLSIASPSGFVTTGAATLAFLAAFTKDDSTQSRVIAVEGFGETEDTNGVFNFDVETTLLFQSNHEYGAGVNVTINYNAGPVPGMLQHIVVTRSSDGLTYKVYVDGQLVDTGTASNAPTGGSSATVHLLGSADPTNYFHGFLACALFTKEEWSAAQVLESYQFCRRLG